MAIEFRCSCGHAYAVEEAKAGELFHCEACGMDVPVPKPLSPDERKAIVDDMVSQVLSSGEPVRKGEGAGALKEEVAAAGVAGLSQEEAARRQAAREEFRAQLGQKVGADELLEQIHGIRRQPAREEQGAPFGEVVAPTATDAAATPPARRPAATAAEAAKALRLAAPPKPLPKGKARAASHIRVKRVVWAPSLVLGLICLAGGLYFVDALTLNLLWHQKAKFPPINTPEPRMLVTDDQGEVWAMPKDANYSMHPDGKIWYQNEYGAEEPAEMVKDMKAALAFDRRLKEGALWFAPSFLVVGMILVFLGLWTLNDVRIVKREMGTTEVPTADLASKEDVAAAVTAGSPAAAGTAQPPAAATPAEGASAGPPADAMAATTAATATGEAAAVPPPESVLPPPECEGMPPAPGGKPDAKPPAGAQTPKQA